MWGLQLYIIYFIEMKKIRDSIDKRNSSYKNVQKKKKIYKK